MHPANAAATTGHTENLSRHDRKCCVCRHRERAEIEAEFLHWRSAESIAKEHGIAHHSSIYRHAHATGLFAQRATYLRLALSPIIEQAMVVPVTADSIVRAVALYARLNDDGEWVNPPKHVIHYSSKPQSSAATERASPEASEGLNVALACPDGGRGSSAQHPSGPVAGAPNPNSENASSTT